MLNQDSRKYSGPKFLNMSDVTSFKGLVHMGAQILAKFHAHNPKIQEFSGVCSPGAFELAFLMRR